MKPLTDKDVQILVRIIQSMNEKVTWDGIIELFEKKTSRLYTRAGISRHTEVRNAYLQRKVEIRKEWSKKPRWKQQIELQSRLAVCNEKIRDLEQQVNRLIAEIVSIRGNAVRMGYELSELNAPLDRPDRQRTKIAARN